MSRSPRRGRPGDGPEPTRGRSSRSERPHHRRPARRQNGFRKGLIRNVRMFVVDVRSSAPTSRPTARCVPGLRPGRRRAPPQVPAPLRGARAQVGRVRGGRAALRADRADEYPSSRRPRASCSSSTSSTTSTRTCSDVVEFNDLAGTEVLRLQREGVSTSHMVKESSRSSSSARRCQRSSAGGTRTSELKKTVDDFWSRCRSSSSSPTRRCARATGRRSRSSPSTQTALRARSSFDLLTLGIRGLGGRRGDLPSAVKELAIEGKLNDIERLGRARAHLRRLQAARQHRAQHGRDCGDDGSSRGVADGPWLDACVALRYPLQGAGQ